MSGGLVKRSWAASTRESRDSLRERESRLLEVAYVEQRAFCIPLHHFLIAQADLWLGFREV
jgi:hypothetical protein